MLPFYKKRQSPEELREISKVLWEEAESGFQSRWDSKGQALKNEDFFCFAISPMNQTIFSAPNVKNWKIQRG